MRSGLHFGGRKSNPDVGKQTPTSESKPRRRREAKPDVGKQTPTTSESKTRRRKAKPDVGKQNPTTSESKTRRRKANPDVGFQFPTLPASGLQRHQHIVSSPDRSVNLKVLCGVTWTGKPNDTTQNHLAFGLVVWCKRSQTNTSEGCAWWRRRRMPTS
jgi:hypothetical protein